ncbi:TatD family nuclease-associated radical SAM protein [Treponema sp.]|uniref:TatD family nuclease-associated radical SAM protein n=1 Tax=Treponema sp. TaxID=166 RepID=UPI003EFEA070
MKKAMTVVYPVGSGLYINLTNKCPCSCTFCIRQSSKNEFEHIETLWLEHEPDFDEVVQAIKDTDVSAYNEIIFCGYGEPTEALSVLLKTADFLKSNYNIPIRLNTNGLGNLINGKDITPLLKGRIDAVSISLNSSNPEIYEKTVRPVFGREAFPALLDFARKAAAFVPRVVLSTVSTTITKEDEDECRRLCESLGVAYRIREYEPPAV